MRETIWIIWAKRAALLAVIVGVANGMALLFPHSHVWHHYETVDMPASPLVFASTLAAELVLLYFWRLRDERK